MHMCAKYIYICNICIYCMCYIFVTYIYNMYMYISEQKEHRTVLRKNSILSCYLEVFLKLVHL